MASALEAARRSMRRGACYVQRGSAIARVVSPLRIRGVAWLVQGFHYWRNGEARGAACALQIAGNGTMKGRQFCDDWSCPAQASCGHAFWRSRAYAAMTIPAPPTRKFARRDGDEACTDYYTDKPRPWLFRDVHTTARGRGGSDAVTG